MSLTDDEYQTSQVQFAIAFGRATEPTPMYYPGMFSGLWNKHVQIVCEARPERNVIVLSSIQATPAFNGHGGRAMKWLCDLADQHEILLTLQVEPFGYATTPLAQREKLAAWYKRRGFSSRVDDYKLMRYPAI